jgi:hypothetical protein
MHFVEKDGVTVILWPTKAPSLPTKIIVMEAAKQTH